MQYFQVLQDCQLVPGEGKKKKQELSYYSAEAIPNLSILG